jgi:hypothetical protein
LCFAIVVAFSPPNGPYFFVVAGWSFSLDSLARHAAQTHVGVFFAAHYNSDETFMIQSFVKAWSTTGVTTTLGVTIRPSGAGWSVAGPGYSVRQK